MHWHHQTNVDEISWQKGIQVLCHRQLPLWDVHMTKSEVLEAFNAFNAVAENESQKRMCEIMMECVQAVYGRDEGYLWAGRH